MTRADSNLIRVLLLLILANLTHGWLAFAYIAIAMYFAVTGVLIEYLDRRNRR